MACPWACACEGRAKAGCKDDGSKATGRAWMGEGKRRAPADTRSRASWCLPCTAPPHTGTAAAQEQCLSHPRAGKGGASPTSTPHPTLFLRRRPYLHDAVAPALPARVVALHDDHLELKALGRQRQLQRPRVALPPLHGGCALGTPPAQLRQRADDLEALAVRGHVLRDKKAEAQPRRRCGGRQGRGRGRGGEKRDVIVGEMRDLSARARGKREGEVGRGGEAMTVASACQTARSARAQRLDTGGLDKCATSGLGRHACLQN